LLPLLARIADFRNRASSGKVLSGRADLNRRPHGPESGRSILACVHTDRDIGETW